MTEPWNDRADERVISEFRAHNGVVGGSLAGLSLLLLHHVGARSGAERVTPLAYWPLTNTSVAVLASNFGASQHPGWHHNLMAHPIASVEIGTTTWNVRARVARSDERRDVLDRITRLTPLVARVIAHTRREIPVVVLDRIEAYA